MGLTLELLMLYALCAGPLAHHTWVALTLGGRQKAHPRHAKGNKGSLQQSSWTGHAYSTTTCIMCMQQLTLGACSGGNNPQARNLWIPLTSTCRATTKLPALAMLHGAADKPLRHLLAATQLADVAGSTVVAGDCLSAQALSMSEGI